MRSSYPTPKHFFLEHSWVDFPPSELPTFFNSSFLYYFEQYGNIIEFEMPYDKVKKQRKGFGFITFEREETMKELIKRGKVTIGEHDVDLRKATPKTDFGGFGGGMGMMMGGGFRGGGGGGMGGGGGGGGGWGGPMDFYGGYAAGEKIIFHPRTIKHTAF